MSKVVADSVPAGAAAAQASLPAPALSDRALIDVSELCLDELLAELLSEADERKLDSALRWVLAPGSDCANSFQSSI
jgi:hypothetical protein